MNKTISVYLFSRDIYTDLNNAFDLQVPIDLPRYYSLDYRIEGKLYKMMKHDV